jgi:glutamate-1-semialdehyde 2,1-aminomutase
MSDKPTPFTNSQIVAAYEQRTRTSKARHLAAREVFPSGIVHDSRYMKPHPLTIERAEGSWKWDADGNKYIDFYGGHGALLLGHAHPSLVEAVSRQISLGTHPAACHDLELEWGQLVQRLELVRFKNHFHGWQDHVAFGSSYAGAEHVPGIIDGIIENDIVADPADPGAVRATLETGDDIAAVILEPTGASSGQVPLGRDFVKMLREATTARDIVLIFDEVVTGFRVSPGGVQGAMGLLPDLTTLAKILSGGLPGGAVCGRRDILQLLDFEAAEAHGFQKIPHQGTFLRQIAEDGVTERANEQGRKLSAALNRVFAEEAVAWAAYGQGSSVYLFTNPDGLAIDPLTFDGTTQPLGIMEKAAGHGAAKLFRLALLVNGVDVSSKLGAIVSAVHTDDDIAQTAEATRRALAMLKAEGLFQV